MTADEKKEAVKQVMRDRQVALNELREAQAHVQEANHNLFILALDALPNYSLKEGLQSGLVKFDIPLTPMDRKELYERINE